MKKRDDESIERERHDNFLVTQAQKRTNDDHQVHAKEEKQQLQHKFSKSHWQQVKEDFKHELGSYKWIEEVDTAEASKVAWLEITKSNCYYNLATSCLEKLNASNATIDQFKRDLMKEQIPYMEIDENAISLKQCNEDLERKLANSAPMIIDKKSLLNGRKGSQPAWPE